MTATASPTPGHVPKVHAKHHASLAPVAHLALLVVTGIAATYGIDSNINLIIQASLCVFAGCWRSLKPREPSDSMTASDAMQFPLIGSAVLLSLYLVIRYVGKELANRVLSFYFLFLGTFSVAHFLSPFLGLALPQSLVDRTFQINFPKIPVLNSEGEPLTLDVGTLAMVPVGMAVSAWYAMTKTWLSNNTIGIAFSIVGIEEIGLGSTKAGLLLLVGLFFYDIFWVFFTPVMVSVAKGLDAPIKLLFPRPDVPADDPRHLALLGLGDIVIPGIFIALLLRLDFRRAGGDPSRLRPKYFAVSMVGYVLGLVATVLVMIKFQAAQPALLYLVPGISIPPLVLAAVSGELGELWGYSEEEGEGKEDKEGKEKEEGGAADRAGEGEEKKDK